MLDFSCSGGGNEWEDLLLWDFVGRSLRNMFRYEVCRSLDEEGEHRYIAGIIFG